MARKCQGRNLSAEFLIESLFERVLHPLTTETPRRHASIRIIDEAIPVAPRGLDYDILSSRFASDVTPGTHLGFSWKASANAPKLHVPCRKPAIDALIECRCAESRKQLDIAGRALTGFSAPNISGLIKGHIIDWDHFLAGPRY
jgi:hypothetical protein